MSRVSVIIPPYNRARFIDAAVRSVLTQTYRNVEVIVVDDASQDNTPGILGELQKFDSRVKYVRHDANRGAQGARNTGIKASTGSWIAFLDSDDQWLPESLEVRLNAAERSQRRVVHSECLVLTTDSSQAQPFGTPAMEGSVYRDLLRRPGPTYQSLLVSKDALVRIGYLDEAIVAYQEWETSIRLARFYEFEFLPEPTFVYDCRHTDTISGNPSRSARGYEQVFSKHRLAILRHLGPRGLVHHYQTAAELYESANDDRNARRCLRAAFIWWPFRAKTIFKRLQRAVSPKT